MTDHDIGEFQSMLRRSVHAFEPPEGIEGRGIVTCAGGLQLFTNVYVLIRLLRERLKCSLPIQVWTFGGEELSPRMRHILCSLDVEIIDIQSPVFTDGRSIASGWQLKSLAILRSRFAEVLFLDADQVPVVDPAFLFQSEQYRTSGAVFWPDTLTVRADNPIWPLLGLPAEEVTSWESGQLIVDKRCHWRALQLMELLNTHADTVYDKIYGDKDTFLVAWRWLNADHELIPHAPFRDARVIVQRDFDGKPIFHHRTDAKWIYGGKQYRYDGEVLVEECEQYLTDLRGIWNGRLFFPPDRTMAARNEEARLETMPAKLEIVGDHSVDIHFGEAHEITTGRSADRQNWYIDEIDRQFQLVLTDGSRPSYRLQKTMAGFWEGSQIATVAGKVRLREIPTQPTEKTDAGIGIVAGLVAASGIDSKTTISDKAASELVIALTLLLKAEPGARPAVELLRSRSDLLSQIVDDIFSLCPETVDYAPERNTSILSTGYKERPMKV